MTKKRTNLVTKDMLQSSWRRTLIKTSGAAILIALLAASPKAHLPKAKWPSKSHALVTQKSTSLPSQASRAIAASKQNTEFQTLAELIQAKFGSSKTLVGLETAKKEKELDISFSTNRIFPGGSAEFQADHQAELSDLVTVIQSHAREANIQIEGHTDSIPVIKNRKLFRSNWELGGARAAAMVRLFEQAGINKNQLEAISYGESRPKFSQGSRNRRLVIRLLKKDKDGS